MTFSRHYATQIIRSIDISSRPLLKKKVVTVSGPSGSMYTYAMLDDRSTATFIEATLAAEIGVQGLLPNSTSIV